MRSYFFILFFFAFCFQVLAKPPKKKKHTATINLDEIVIKPTDLLTDYKASNLRKFDLLHTKIEIEPKLATKTADATAELTLTPYFYPQSVLELDAKYMSIKSIYIQHNNKTIPLSYNYDSLQVQIYLDHTYSKSDTFKIIVEYIAQPYSLPQELVDIDGRGMYFINPNGKNPYKPFHIWTQGEVEANSFWFPTIDAPNERCSQEIFVTVDTAYLSLSNGKLISSKVLGNKRIDYWKQDKPHAPYLFFLGIGDYKKYSTIHNNLEVDYYTFPEYYKDVHQVFEHTPEMIDFFSNLFQVEFPWDKYAQIIAYDYTAGAMENSSASIFYDALLATHQELIDDNYDLIIAHELVHQWFGDLVTAESWANLSLNESFADYGEYLWMEHQFGKTDADAFNRETMNKYFNRGLIKDQALVNYYYYEHRDNFDVIRYEKGGRILNMLRYYIGDDAFFKSLQLYLNQNKYSSAEVSDFRKAVEQITGEDMNWFFNQWFFEKNHPELDVKYTYSAESKNIEVKVKQVQAKNAITFKIPTYIDVYYKDTIIRKPLQILNREATFYFPSKEKPLFVNFDPDGVLLASINENLTIDEQVLRFQKGKNYIDRYRALNALSAHLKNNNTLQNLFLQALQNQDWNTQLLALQLIEPQTALFESNLLSTVLKDLILRNKKTIIRKTALQTLYQVNKNNAFDMAQYIESKDSSLQCIASALSIIKDKNYDLAYQKAVKYLDTKNSNMMTTIGTILKDTTINHLDFFKKAIWLNNYKTYFQNFENLSNYLVNTKDKLLFDEGINFLYEINQYEESSFNFLGANQALNSIRNNLEYLQKDKKNLKTNQELYTEKLKLLNTIIPKLRKNDFGY